MPNSSELLVSLLKGVLTLTLNRPTQRNALDLPMLRALRQALEGAHSQAEVRCVVLRSSGTVFCAGADLKEWAEAEEQGRLQTYGWTEAAHQVMVQLQALPKPTLAVIQGSAVGAGLDLALCCDLRVAGRAARLRAGYTRMAYSPDAGASWHLPRLIGQEQARRFLFLDEAWDGERAHRIGLVGQLCEDHELNDQVQLLAEQLARGPTFAYGQTKELLQSSATRTLAEQLEAERISGLACGQSADASEALAAVATKRTPIFIGQ